MTGRDSLPVIQDTLDDVSRWLGLPCLLLTHITGGEQIVVAAHDEVYGISIDDRWPWESSLCAEMVYGGPNIVADTAGTPYEGMLLAGKHKVGAYVGVPITHHDTLYGTLAAFAPEPEPIGIYGALPIVQRLAELLATLTQQHLELVQVRRMTNAVAAQAQLDPLTKVGNRFAWERALEEEEERCRRFAR
ncbi:MAG: GAF domain-containing protein, partial [Mycobacteriales bacterium]